MPIICLFGIYDPAYSRNRILTQGFRENGWKVVECRVDPTIYRGWSKYLELIKVWRRTKLALGENKMAPEILLVAFPGHTVVWLAWILCRGRRIVFDAFLSRLDSNVYDRQSYGSLSIRGLADWLLDWSSCALAPVVLLDTQQHIDYFARKFFVKTQKMIRVPVGADTKNFYPNDKSDCQFIVHFHGMFIPLQGIRYIVDAADLLREQADIIFNIVGSGQQYQEISRIIEAKKLSNINLLGLKPLSELPKYIEQADVCLGIFGETAKAGRVIPNKVYEYIAMKKAVITADTPAIREFFTNETDMLLCKRADGRSIADAIMRLKNNPRLISELAEKAHSCFKEKMLPRLIVSDLLKALQL